MKKHLLILVIACLVINVKNAKSQTCVDAFSYLSTNPNYFNQVPLPPPGTVSAPGPSLGCLTVTNRQVWFYWPVCETVFFDRLNVGHYSDSPVDTVGMILYGPFHNKVSNCTDLDASKIMACDQMPLGLFSASYIDVNDTIHAGNYYYILFTFTDTYVDSLVWPSFGLPWGATQNFHNCFECNNQISVLYGNTKNICMVSVDTSINKFKIIYDEVAPAQNLEGYKILRESNLVGVYDSISSLPIASLSEYTDVTSNPGQKSYKYAVVGYDSCGNSFNPPGGILTIHLLTFAGSNNQAELIWNNVYYYNGNAFEPQYFIYRNNAATGWQLIDSIGITQPNITYTDIFAPAGINSYTVELRKIVPCVPMMVQTYQSVFSNVTDVIVTGIDELSNNNIIHIFPNPANTSFALSINSTTNEPVEVRIYNTLGSQVYFSKEETVTGKFSKQINVENFSNGIYFLQVKTKEGVASKKVVVGH